MKYRSKLLLVLIFFGVIFTLYVSYYRAYISRDYIFTIEQECDVESEQCFGFENDEGEIINYKIMQIQAAKAYSICGNEIGECELSCEMINNDKMCRYIYCGDDNAGKYGECSI